MLSHSEGDKTNGEEARRMRAHMQREEQDGAMQQYTQLLALGNHLEAAQIEKIRESNMHTMVHIMH